MRNNFDLNPNMNTNLGPNLMNGPTGFPQQSVGTNPLGINMSRPPPNQNLMDTQIPRMNMQNNDQAAQLVSFNIISIIVLTKKPKLLVLTYLLYGKDHVLQVIDLLYCSVSINFFWMNNDVRFISTFLSQFQKKKTNRKKMKKQLEQWDSASLSEMEDSWLIFHWCARQGFSNFLPNLSTFVMIELRRNARRIRRTLKLICLCKNFSWKKSPKSVLRFSFQLLLTLITFLGASYNGL